MTQQLFLQAEQGTASDREKALSAQIAELTQKQSGSEQETQEELERLRAELAEFSSGLAQRDSELQVGPHHLCQSLFDTLILLAVQLPQQKWLMAEWDMVWNSSELVERADAPHSQLWAPFQLCCISPLPGLTQLLSCSHVRYAPVWLLMLHQCVEFSVTQVCQELLHLLRMKPSHGSPACWCCCSSQVCSCCRCCRMSFRRC